MDGPSDPARRRGRSPSLAPDGLLPAAARDPALRVVRALVDRRLLRRARDVGHRARAGSGRPAGCTTSSRPTSATGRTSMRTSLSPQTRIRASPASRATRSTSRSRTRNRRPAGRSCFESCSRSRRSRWRPSSAGDSTRRAAARRAATRAEAAFYYVSIGGAVAACAFLGWFASLALGRMPNGLRDLAAYGVGLRRPGRGRTRFCSPTATRTRTPRRIGPTWSLPPHQVRLELSDDGRRSRLTVFFRLLLALPHFVWLVLWSVAAFVAAIANGLVALVRGRSAEPSAPLPRRVRALHGARERVRRAGREPVPRLHRRTRLPGRHRDRPARPPAPPGHPLPTSSS